MLRYRRLAEIELVDDVGDVTFLGRKVDQDVAALSFSDGVEDVGCRRSTRHESNYIPTTEYVNTTDPRVRGDSTYAICEMLPA